MSYDNEKLEWTSKGWVRVKPRGVTLKLKSPVLNLSLDYIDAYDKAEINELWDLKDKNTDVAVGYTREETPSFILKKWWGKRNRFLLKTVCKFIPFVNVEVIE